MDTLLNVMHGFGVALLPINLLYCFIGVFIGTLVGVLPGIGPISAMSLLLPVTLSGTPESGIIMMAGIYYGSMYGGSTTSILVNIPGEAASVVTCIDGHQMAKQGRAGPALGISALGSFIAGTFSLIALMLVAPSLASVAIAFGPAEYFSLMVLGLVVLTFLTQGSMAKALLMACIGIVLGLIGLDSITAQPRLTFGRMELIDGIGLVPVVMGLFGIAEVLFNTEQVIKRDIINAKITQLLPNKADWKASAGPVARGTILGFFLGILPGGGAVVASFASYALEKRLSRTPERFGNGAIEGVAAPESANNAAAQACFIPMLSLGIPPNALMALMIGAMTVHGITPGPEIITKQPALFWGLIASMWLGNLMLVILNLPLIGIWVRLLQVPYSYLFPSILILCCIGTYTLSSSIGDVLVMTAFGVIGYGFRKLDCEPAPLLLGLVLGPMLEENFRRAMVLADGDWSVFVRRPISLGFLLLAMALLLTMALPNIRRSREKAFRE